MLIGRWLVANRCVMLGHSSQSPQQRFHVANSEVRRGQRHARAGADAIELQVPLTVEMRLRQGDAPIAVKDAVDCFPKTKLQRRRDFPQTKRDRHEHAFPPWKVVTGGELLG